ncbi:tetratricopeptide repeat protein [Candidatus Auribacterota bacterium]
MKTIKFILMPLFIFSLLTIPAAAVSMFSDEETKKAADDAEKYFEQKNYKKSIECWKKVLESEPDDATAYNNIGVGYGQLGDYSKALSNLDKAIEVTGSWWGKETPTYNKGWTYNKWGKYSQAIPFLEAAKKINMKYTDDGGELRVRISYHLGLSYNETKNFDKAIENLKIAHKNKSNDPEYATSIPEQFSKAYTGKGNEQFKKGLYNAAIKTYNNALEHKQTNPAAWRGRAFAHYQRAAKKENMLSKEDKFSNKDVYSDFKNVINDLNAFKKCGGKMDKDTTKIYNMANQWIDKYGQLKEEEEKLAEEEEKQAELSAQPEGEYDGTIDTKRWRASLIEFEKGKAAFNAGKFTGNYDDTNAQRQFFDVLGESYTRSRPGFPMRELSYYMIMTKFNLGKKLGKLPTALNYYTAAAKLIVEHERKFGATDHLSSKNKAEAKSQLAQIANAKGAIKTWLKQYKMTWKDVVGPELATAGYVTEYKQSDADLTDKKKEIVEELSKGFTVVDKGTVELDTKTGKKTEGSSDLLPKGSGAIPIKIKKTKKTALPENDQKALEIFNNFDKTQDINKSISQMNQIISLNPKTTIEYKKGKKMDLLAYAHNILATVYSQKKEYGKALENYKKYISLTNDKSSSAKNMLNNLTKLAKQESTTKPSEKNEKALKAYKEGKTSLAAKQYSKAIEQFKKAVNLKPDYTSNGKSLLNYAKTNLAKSYWNQGYQHYKAYKNEKNISAKVLQLQKAVSNYNNALKYDPKNAKIKTGLATLKKHLTIAQKQKNTQPKEKLSSKNEKALAEYQNGLKYYYKGDYKKALPYFRKAISMNPDYAKKGKSLKEMSYYRSAVCKYRNKDYEGALKDFNTYNKISKIKMSGFANMYALAKKRVEGLKQTTKIDPDDLKRRSNTLTVEQAKLKKKMEAEYASTAYKSKASTVVKKTTAKKTTVKKASSKEKVYLNRALANLKKGNYENAYSDLKQVRKLNSKWLKNNLELYKKVKNLNLYKSQAKKALSKSDYTKAQDYISKIKALDRGFMNNSWNKGFYNAVKTLKTDEKLAQNYYKTGRYDKALAKIKKIAAKDKNFLKDKTNKKLYENSKKLETYVKKAKSYAAKGDYKRALALLDQCKKTDSNFVNIPINKNLIKKYAKKIDAGKSTFAKDVVKSAVGGTAAGSVHEQDKKKLADAKAAIVTLKNALARSKKTLKKIEKQYGKNSKFYIRFKKLYDNVAKKIRTNESMVKKFEAKIRSVAPLSSVAKKQLAARKEKAVSTYNSGSWKGLPKSTYQIVKRGNKYYRKDVVDIRYKSGKTGLRLSYTEKYRSCDKNGKASGPVTEKVTKANIQHDSKGNEKNWNEIITKTKPFSETYAYRKNGKVTQHAQYNPKNKRNGGYSGNSKMVGELKQIKKSIKKGKKPASAIAQMKNKFQNHLNVLAKKERDQERIRKSSARAIKAKAKETSTHSGKKAGSEKYDKLRKKVEDEYRSTKDLK